MKRLLTLGIVAVLGWILVGKATHMMESAQARQIAQIDAALKGLDR